MEIPFQIEEIMDRLEKAGYSAYIVGGCVRDSLMGLEPHDYDVTTSALPNETERVFADCRVVETGIKHGTVTVLYKGMSIEITTFRLDGNYSDGRHPDSVSFTDNIAEDLSRRDFTMNGIAYSPKRGMVDPFDGAEDIKAGVIRCIGDSDKRFDEDALRILRALRFSSVLGFDIEENTANSIRRKKDDLRKVSVERIFSEIKRLLCGDNVKRVMLDFPEVFALIFPPLEQQIGYNQHSRFHNSTLYEHTVRAVASAEKDPDLRLAMLFHDMGKPECRSTDENGEGHYYGHAAVSARIADEQLRALKCDNSSRERICEIVKYHDIPIQLSKKFIRRQLAKHGLSALRDIIKAHIADDSAKVPEASKRIPDWREVLKMAEQIDEEQPCLSLSRLAISGKDLGKFEKPSPKYGEVLNQLLSEVIEEEIPNERDILLKRAEELFKR